MPVCGGVAIPERGALAGQLYPVRLGLEVHLELAAPCPQGTLAPAQDLCVPGACGERELE